jgi:DNA-binding response OmpR family regulator
MPAASKTPLRVLVAEDEPAMLSLVARHLKNMGFSVVEASEGDAAWRLAQEHVPDLVILDVMMPGMSGWEVCRRIKSEASDGGPFAATGVVMLTGIGENLNDMTSPLFSADAWLNKPFEFAELDQRVRETLRRYGKALAEPGGEGARAGGVPRRPAKAGAQQGSATDGGPRKAAKKAGAAVKKTAAKKAAGKKTAAKKAAGKKAATRRG